MLPRPPPLFQSAMNLFASIWHPDGQKGCVDGVVKEDYFIVCFSGGGGGDRDLRNTMLP